MSSSEPRHLLEELAKLEKLRDPEAAKQRRQFQRFIVRGDGEIRDVHRSHADDRPLPVMLRDLGRGGVGFLCDQALRVGTVWSMRFLQRGYEIGHVHIVVRHSTAVEDGVHLIGSQVCVGDGMMYLLGVDPAMIRDGDNPTVTAASAAFLPPEEVD